MVCDFTRWGNPKGENRDSPPLVQAKALLLRSIKSILIYGLRLYAMGESKGGESRFSPFGASKSFAFAQHKINIDIWFATLRDGGIQRGRIAILPLWCKQKLCFCAA